MKWMGRAIGVSYPKKSETRQLASFGGSEYPTDSPITRLASDHTVRPTPLRHEPSCKAFGIVVPNSQVDFVRRLRGV